MQTQVIAQRMAEADARYRLRRLETAMSRAQRPGAVLFFFWVLGPLRCQKDSSRISGVFFPATTMARTIEGPRLRACFYAEDQSCVCVYE